jgi:hypothetical protein
MNPRIRIIIVLSVELQVCFDVSIAAVNRTFRLDVIGLSDELLVVLACVMFCGSFTARLLVSLPALELVSLVDLVGRTIIILPYQSCWGGGASRFFIRLSLNL